MSRNLSQELNMIDDQITSHIMSFLTTGTLLGLVPTGKVPLYKVKMMADAKNDQAIKDKRAVLGTLGAKE